MKKNHCHLAISLTGAVLFAAAVSASADQDQIIYLTSTNRVTLSLRYGLNIHARFMGIGGSPIPGSIYNDGYVVTTSPPNTSPNPNYTTYWGYNSAQQLVPSGTPGEYTGVAFINPGAAGVSSGDSGGDKPYPGVELTYDRELLDKENWHDLRIGMEAAVNYMKISLDDNSTFAGANAIDIYNFPIAIPQPPFTDTGAPGQSALQVPGSHPESATFSTQDHFDANLLGLRLGPYVELPFGDKEQFTISLSAGLAVGLLDASESWKQTVTFGDNSITSNGSGNNFDALFGFYAGAKADYQFSEHWGIAVGAQFQDLGTYDHSFDGREVQLDLSRSIFFLAGVSYNF